MVCSLVVAEASVGIVILERIGISLIERILTYVVHDSKSFILDVLLINQLDRSVNRNSFYIQILTRLIWQSIEISSILLRFEKLLVSLTEEIIFNRAYKNLMRFMPTLVERYLH